jgi:hypothetical protein
MSYGTSENFSDDGSGGSVAALYGGESGNIAEFTFGGAETGRLSLGNVYGLTLGGVGGDEAPRVDIAA